MNLRAAANAITRAVNPNVPATLRRCSGYDTSASGKRTPAYAADEPITIQEQSLSTEELKHVDSLNIQGTLAGFWMNGPITAADRRTGVGGDLVIIDGVTWLCVHVLENWRRSGWSHFVGQQQTDDVIP